MNAYPPHALLRPAIIVPFALCALIWGATWYAIKDQLAAAPPSWSIAWRFAVAAPAMALLAFARGQSFRLDRQGHILAAILGVTHFCVNFHLLYRAEAYLTSGIVAVVFALLMLPNALFGRIFLGIRVTPRFWAGTVVALAGIALLVLHEARTAAFHGTVLLGVVLTCSSILTSSAANVMQAGVVARRQPILSMLAWAMGWGALADFAIAFAFAGPPVLPLDPRYITGVLFLAILGSVVAFPLYFQLVRELGPARAAYNSLVIPIVAMGISTVLEGYRWSLLAGGGAALALLGTVIALRARNPAR